jgi:hypothetical protein
MVIVHLTPRGGRREHTPDLGAPPGFSAESVVALIVTSY